MKTTALVAVLLAISATAVPAKNSGRRADPEVLHKLLQQKLSSGVSAHRGGVVINVQNPDRPPAKGWHYMDALYCGWYYNGGNPQFYAYDGNTVLWDTSDDHMLATALAIPCVHGYQLGYHVSGVPYDFTYDKTESFTYY